MVSNVPWWPVREVSWVHFQCKANSSVHCSQGPQQHVNDDYCACRVKAVGEIHIIGALHFFSEQGPR